MISKASHHLTFTLVIYRNVPYVSLYHVKMPVTEMGSSIEVILSPLN